MTEDPITCTSTSVVFTEEQRCHRRFDEASRLLNRVDASLEYDVERFSFDGSFQTIQSDMNRPGGTNSPSPLNFLTGSAASTAPYFLYGALKDISYIYTFDVNYTVSSQVSLFAEYAHEKYYKRMISRNRTPTSGVQTILTCAGCDTANNDWESSYHDIFDTYAAGVDFYLGKRFYLTPYYSLAAGKGNVFSRALGDSTIGSGANKFVLTGTSMPQDYPETTTRIHEAAVVFKYNLTKNIQPKVEYRYQQFDNKDYQTSAMTPYMGCIGTISAPVTGCPSATANVGIPQPSSFYPGFVVGDTSAARFIFLGVDQPSYHVHVLSATIEYNFRAAAPSSKLHVGHLAVRLLHVLAGDLGKLVTRCLLLSLQSRQPRFERRHFTLRFAKVFHLPRQLSILGFELVRLLRQGTDFRVLLHAQTIQRLHARQRHALAVNVVNVLVVLAQAEGGVQVLRHGAHVTDRRLLGFVAPRAHGNTIEPREEILAVHLLESLLGVAIAHARPRPAARRQADARVQRGAGEKFHSSGGKRQELPGSTGKVDGGLDDRTDRSH